MQIGPIHFCQDEMAQIALALPFIPLIIARVKSWWRRLVSR